ncbi:hypothetical protein [Carboxylicivirga caseinilyticus]|uniref:hypothetical protein n=1 Tax=Carboxylicivirga caseinilyticus TaxID=3417572 RepID=UPI003D33D3A7|nr:hypothetical protein [Marinilabiliaceae bacterium A049]
MKKSITKMGVILNCTNKNMLKNIKTLKLKGVVRKNTNKYQRASIKIGGGDKY